MFKKAFKLHTSSPLKKSEHKKLRETLKDEALLNSLVGIKTAVEERRLADSHTLIYFVDGQPLFFDLSGRGEMFPTVYALWKVPSLLPVLSIHPPVFQYILSGADLMLPGVVVPPEGLGEFLIGQKRVIVLLGSNAPVAVGTMAVTAKQAAAAGMKGKALKVLHSFHDQLWALGNKDMPPVSCSLTLPDLEASESIANGSDTNSENGGGVVEGESALLPPPPGPEDSLNPAPVSPTSIGVGENESTIPTVPTRETVAAEADVLLRWCFLEAVKSRVKDRDLPMLFNTFYSNCMLACKPPEAQLDIKKTSFKKLSKFVDEMVREGLVAVAEPSPGVFQLTTINRSHHLYRSHTVAVKATSEETGESAESPLIVELFKPVKNLQPLFAQSGEELYTRHDLQVVLWTYVKEKKLSDKADVKLDALLADTLFPKGTVAGQSVAKKDLFDTFVAKMSKFYQVHRGTLKEIRKGAVQPLRVKAEQRQARKFVTRLNGLETFAIVPHDLAHELQKKFAAATTVNQLEEKGAGQEVQIQGNFAAELETLLLEQYQVPRKYLVVENAIKKKPAN